MNFSSSYAKQCQLCGRRKGIQPGGRGYVVLVRRRVNGKEVQVCKTCLLINKRFIK